MANINLFFVTVGAALNVLSSDVTLGLSYGWGRDTVPIALADAAEGDQIIGRIPRTFDMEYRSLRLILAFSI
jgi:hypothetical protein